MKCWKFERTDALPGNYASDRLSNPPKVH